MKSCPSSMTFLYACLLLAVVWLLIEPPKALAETRSANCGGGRTVTCTAATCICTENVGCTGYDAQGNVVVDKPCPSDPGLIE
jgi:hypothetical protein